MSLRKLQAFPGRISHSNGQNADLKKTWMEMDFMRLHLGLVAGWDFCLLIYVKDCDYVKDSMLQLVAMFLFVSVCI